MASPAADGPLRALLEEGSDGVVLFTYLQAPGSEVSADQ
jgi:hypothetical protein